MKIFRYIKYFFYVAINWNWKIAAVTIKEELAGEKKYGINTTGEDELKKLKKKGKNFAHATIYMPVSYHIIEKAIEKIPSANKNHFIDIGCGKGRALVVAAHYGFKKITGIEWAEKLSNEANKNLHLTKTNFPSIVTEIINGDAAIYEIPADADCIFLFNPFDDFIMKKVVANIFKSLKENPRTLHVIYANPLYKRLFLDGDFYETFHYQRYHYFEVSILSVRHS